MMNQWIVESRFCKRMNEWTMALSCMIVIELVTLEIGYQWDKTRTGNLVMGFMTSYFMAGVLLEDAKMWPHDLSHYKATDVKKMGL